jgi:hypothetical protein
MNGRLPVDFSLLIPSLQNKIWAKVGRICTLLKNKGLMVEISG